MHIVRYIIVSVLFLLITGLAAQNPTTPDTLAKPVQQPARPDSTAISPPVQQQKQQTQATTHVRKDNRPLKDRIDFDLNTSFWMNTSQVFGQASLLISYRFPQILSIGTGPTYLFNYQRGDNQNLNGFGGIIFARAQLLKFFYLWTEYQGIDNQYPVLNEPPATGYSREFRYVDSWCLGAGFNIRLGRRFGINMSVLYDILYGSDSPYYSATTYRVGFSF